MRMSAPKLEEAIKDFTRVFKASTDKLVAAIDSNTAAVKSLRDAIDPFIPGRATPNFVSQRHVGDPEMLIIGFTMKLPEETEERSQDIAHRIVEVSIPDEVQLADGWNVPRVQTRQAVSRMATETDTNAPFEAPVDTFVNVKVTAVDLRGNVSEPDEFVLEARDLVAPARPGRADANFISQREVADIGGGPADGEDPEPVDEDEE